MNDSNMFSTVVYDAHLNTEKKEIILSIMYLNLNWIPIHLVCELERAQLLTKLAMSVQSPQPAGYLLTGNCNIFLYVEGSTV